MSDPQRETEGKYEIARNGFNFRDNSPYKKEIAMRDTVCRQGKGRDS